MLKPKLPTLNLAKVRTLTDEPQGDGLGPSTPTAPATRRGSMAGRQHRTNSSTHHRRAGGSLASHQRTSEGDALTYGLGSSWQASAPAAAASAAAAAKLAVPKLQFGFGTSGGIDASVSVRGFPSTSVASIRAKQLSVHTARPSTHTKPAVEEQQQQVQQQQQQQQQQRHEPHASSQPQHQLHPAGTAGTCLVAQQANERMQSSDEGSSSAWESGAITAAQALKRYSQYMTPFEQSEILDYNEVYFVGRSGAEKIIGTPSVGKCNHGYDDERGDYNVVLHDHLRFRYEVLAVMGKGSFGQVLKCHDFRTNELVAIKIIRNKKRFHHQAMVELKVLKYLVKEDPEHSHNVVHMHDFFTFRSHLCIAFEPLSLNLYEFLKQNNFAGLSLSLIRRFAHQMLVSLKFMKDLRIIHCDLKPENVMLRQPNRSVIKVIDFGSSCMTDERVYTYIQSRFYRAPEVILGLQYGTAIDMWSFGCILAELYTGYPLFPGEDESDQLQCIMELLDVPGRDLLTAASRAKLFFDANLAPRLAVNSQGKARHPGTRTLAAALRCTDAGFLDLLAACITWNPAERITPEQALAHPWVQDGVAQAAKHAASEPRKATAQYVAASTHGGCEAAGAGAAAGGPSLRASYAGSVGGLAVGSGAHAKAAAVVSTPSGVVAAPSGAAATAAAAAAVAAVSVPQLQLGEAAAVECSATLQAGATQLQPKQHHQHQQQHEQQQQAQQQPQHQHQHQYGREGISGGQPTGAAAMATDGARASASSPAAAALTAAVGADAAGSLAAMSLHDAYQPRIVSSLARRVLEEQAVAAAVAAGGDAAGVRALQPTQLSSPRGGGKAQPPSGIGSSLRTSGVLVASALGLPRAALSSPRTGTAAAGLGSGNTFLPTLGRAPGR